MLGINIVVKGRTNGVTTDFDGNYTISNMEIDATLIFTYIGHNAQDVVVNGQSTIKAVMEEGTQALGEVAIVG